MESSNVIVVPNYQNCLFIQFFYIVADIPFDVGHALLKWVYTDEIDVRSPDDTFLLTLLKAARRYQLLPLSDQYVHALFYPMLF